MTKKREPLAVLSVTSEAPGAYPNGTRVRKSIQEDGDAHKPGDMATVCGSIGPIPPSAEFAPWQVGLYGYFVLWDDTPGIPVFVMSNKIGKAETAC